MKGTQVPLSEIPSLLDEATLQKARCAARSLHGTQRCHRAVAGEPGVPPRPHTTHASSTRPIRSPSRAPQYLKTSPEELAAVSLVNAAVARIAAREVL